MIFLLHRASNQSGSWLLSKKRYTELPAISGKKLIRLLRKDGWLLGRKSNHGRTLTKDIGSRTLVTFIPETRESLPVGTLSAIIGSKQTNIEHDGLLKLINKYGI